MGGGEQASTMRDLTACPLPCQKADTDQCPLVVACRGPVSVVSPFVSVYISR